MIAKNTRKLKIAYVITPITFGGAERVNLNFLNNVDRDHFTIVPILFLRPWEAENYFEYKLKQMGIEFFIIPVAKSDSYDLFRVVRCLFKLINLIHGKSYDLIHTHGYLADLLGILVSKISNVPIISTCHGFIYEGITLSFYNKLDCFALKYIDRIISVSEPLKLDLVKSGIKKDKIVVIKNTPDFSQCNDDTSGIRNHLRNSIKVTSNDILIGYIGRLSAEKGLTFLLNSIKLLDNNQQQIKLVVIGEGPQKNELMVLSDRNRLSSNVIFTGFQKNIDEWLKAIDIFVLPSLTEGSPMVLLEAMAHGVPCIASDVGGIPQIIEHNVNGMLVPPSKPDELAWAINALNKNSILRDKISNNAKNKIAQDYNIKEWANAIQRIYVSVCR